MENNNFEWLDNIKYSTSYLKMLGNRYKDKSLPNPKYFSGWFSYMLLKMLNTPFENWEAFKLGIIDKDGRELRKPQGDELQHWNYFKKVIATLKRRLSKTANVSKLNLIFQQLSLLRENNSDNNIEIFHRFLQYCAMLKDNEVNQLIETVLSGDLASIGGKLGKTLKRFSINVPEIGEEIIVQADTLENAKLLILQRVIPEFPKFNINNYKIKEK